MRYDGRMWSCLSAYLIISIIFIIEIMAIKLNGHSEITTSSKAILLLMYKYVNELFGNNQKKLFIWV